MRKIIFLFAAFMMVIVSSCSGDSKAVYEKIEKGQELTQDDYTVILEYLDDAMSSMPSVDTGEMNDDKRMDDFTKKTDEWNKKYEYTQKFITALSEAEFENKLNAKNKKLLDELNKKAEEAF